jgi:glycosyltransferase involved in cell wall biosynthesis
MFTSSLPELPVSKTGNRGWPWTVEHTQPIGLTTRDQDCPRISIVTPSFNQGAFLEETIRSVLLQGYPNLEYIIIDGGSTDNSVEIISKYEPWLTYWVSERDRGQTHAINKGFNRATGQLFSYLNSDDLLAPRALDKIAHVAIEHSGQPILIMGNCEMGHNLGDIFNVWCPSVPGGYLDAILKDSICPQPATFWTNHSSEIPIVFNESLHFCMDYDYWCELIRSGYKVVREDSILAFYRHHDGAKGSNLSGVMWSELAALPMFKAERVASYDDRLMLAEASRRRIRHYIRLETEKAFVTRGRMHALKGLFSAAADDLSILLQRPTLGLLRRLLIPF